jgi:hypothetical protein
MRALPLTIGLLLAAAAAPQAAQAATLAPLKPCYVSVGPQKREPVTIQADGFTPGSAVDVSEDGVTVDSPQALSNGGISGTVPAPYQSAGERPFTLTLTQHDDPANTVSAPTRVAALSLRVKPRKAPPGRRVRFIGAGFTGGGRVYGHYLFAGKLRRSVSLGVPTGPCGHVDAKRRQIPVHKPHTGRWTLQADALKAYDPQPATVFVRLAITVKKVLRAAGSRH